MRKITRSQNCLLAVHIIKVIMDLFIGTFLVSYILSQTPENILGKGLFNIGLFYFSWYLIYAIFEFVCSYFVDRGNKVLFLRIAIIINTLLIISIVLWGELISHWVVFAGAMCGLADAFYYSSYLVMRIGLAESQTVKQYNVLTIFFTNLVKVVVPIVLGYVIEASSLSTIAIYIVILSAIQFVLSLFIKESKDDNSKFEFKKFLNYLKTNKSDFAKLKNIYLGHIPSGFKTTYTVLVVALTVYIFKKDSVLGIYTSIFSLVTALLVALYKLTDNNRHTNKLVIYLLLGVLPVISAVLVVISPNNIVFLMILNFFLTLSSNFTDMLGNTERDVIIKYLNQTEFIAEHQVLVELILCTFRLIAFGIFMLVGLTSNYTLFIAMILFFIAFNPMKFMLLYKQRLIRKGYENA